MATAAAGLSGSGASINKTSKVFLFVPLKNQLDIFLK